MPIKTQLKLVQLQKERPQKVTKYGCANGLIAYHHPNGSIYFSGRMTVKQDGKSKRFETSIGRFGRNKNSGELSLSDATDKWLDAKRWAKNEQRLPSDYFVEIEKKIVDLGKTFKDAVDGFLHYKKFGSHSVKEVTHKEYTNKLYNQVLTRINPNTPIKDLSLSNGGREKICNVIDAIEDGSKFDLGHRCKKLIFQVFEYATLRGWMDDDENPARRLTIEKSGHRSTHHPSIDWDKVPQLMEDINLNRCNAQIQTVLATKMLLLTFLRAGCLTRLEWNWIDDDKNMFIIPGSTSGLKRTKQKNDNVPHYVPISKSMRKILDICGKFNCGEKYVFLPLRESRFSHLDPSSPNNFLKNLGYKDECRAHGWRRTALTVGIDVLKANREVIRRQMGHLPEGKVNKAYDGSTLLDERRDFLEKWDDLLLESGLEI